MLQCFNMRAKTVLKKWNFHYIKFVTEVILGSNPLYKG